MAAERLTRAVARAQREAIARRFPLSGKTITREPFRAVSAEPENPPSARGALSEDALERIEREGKKVFEQACNAYGDFMAKQLSGTSDRYLTNKGKFKADNL